MEQELNETALDSDAFLLEMSVPEPTTLILFFFSLSSHPTTTTTGVVYSVMCKSFTLLMPAMRGKGFGEGRVSETCWIPQ